MKPPKLESLFRAFVLAIALGSICVVVVALAGCGTPPWRKNHHWASAPAGPSP